MEIVYDEIDLRRYFQTAVSVSNDAPVLLDRFLDDAVEVDVDAICDGEMVLIGGIMETTLSKQVCTLVTPHVLYLLIRLAKKSKM